MPDKRSHAELAAEHRNKARSQLRVLYEDLRASKSSNELSMLMASLATAQAAIATAHSVADILDKLDPLINDVKRRNLEL